MAANENTAQSDMSDALISQIMANPCVSFWLKDRYREALRRDPVDACSDASLLLVMLEFKRDQLFNSKG